MHAHSKAAVLTLGAILLAACATGGDSRGGGPVLDGSSRRAFEQSLERMSAQLREDERRQLTVALFRLQFEGFESARDVGRKPRQAIPIEALDGMTFREVLEYADREADVEAFLEGQEPGLSPRFKAPLDDAGGPAAASLAGSAWRVTTNTNGHIDEKEVRFLPDGSFEVPGVEDAPEPERWNQSGKRVRFSFNGEYAVYLGELDSELHMSGEGENINGSHWTWEASRIDSENRRPNSGSRP